jgi:hypothetical protein
VQAHDGAKSRVARPASLIGIAAIMIRCELLRDRNILLVTLDGPLEKADFERLSNAVDPLIASNGKLAGLMIEAQAFPEGHAGGRRQRAGVPALGPGMHTAVIGLVCDAAFAA